MAPEDTLLRAELAAVDVINVVWLVWLPMLPEDHVNFLVPI